MSQDPLIAASEPARSKWLSIRLEENEAAVWSVENVTIFAQRVLGDWMLARSESSQSNHESEAQKATSLPLNLEWKRWALQEETKEIRFWPTFPDRSLVVRTRIPVIVPPQTSVNLYVNLPVWLEISVPHGDDFYTLETVAPSTLSHTWYGSHFEGQLCYALKSRARRSIDDLTYHPLRAVCLFSIRNRSGLSLPVERIQVHPRHLRLYQSGDRLWASSVMINFKGKDAPAELDYPSNAPDYLPEATLVREAAQPVRRESIIDRLFSLTQRVESQ